MKDQTELIQSMQAELHVLHGMLTKLYDMAPDHFDWTQIEIAMKVQSIRLGGKISILKDEQEAYEAQMAFEASQEFDRYSMRSLFKSLDPNA